MRKIFYRGRFIFIPLGIAAFLSLISFIVMQLWNSLLPDILHVGAINFWQALGLFILCKILFGFGKGGRWGPGGAPWMRRRFEERMKNMTPEEREKFKLKMGERMCGYGKFGGKGFDWENTSAAPSGTAE